MFPDACFPMHVSHMLKLHSSMLHSHEENPGRRRRREIYQLGHSGHHSVTLGVRTHCHSTPTLAPSVSTCGTQPDRTSLRAARWILHPGPMWHHYVQCHIKNQVQKMCQTGIVTSSTCVRISLCGNKVDVKVRNYFVSFCCRRQTAVL